MDIRGMTTERIDVLTREFDEWMCLVGAEEDILPEPNFEQLDEDQVREKKEEYLNDLLGWVSDHVCSEDGSNPSWWMSHMLTEDEAAELAGVEAERDDL